MAFSDGANVTIEYWTQRRRYWYSSDTKRVRASVTLTEDSSGWRRMTKQELYERARNNIINARNKEEDRRLASQRRQAEWEREQQAQRERIAQQKELDRQEHRAARKVPAPRVSMPVYRRPVTSETNTQSTQPTFVQPIVARPKPFRIRVEEQPVREPRQRHHREPPSELSEEESRRLEQQWRKKIQRQEEIDRRYQERVKEAKDAVAQALIEAQRRQKQLHVATYPGMLASC